MKRANKFNAKKTQVYGLWFDSKAEALHYIYLLDLQRKRAISNLTLQPKFNLIVDGYLVGTYTPDFFYIENRKQVCEDTKGVRTEAFGVRSKLFRALYPHIELRVNGVAAKKLKSPIEKAAA